jgi:hypothetical protein
MLSTFVVRAHSKGSISVHYRIGIWMVAIVVMIFARKVLGLLSTKMSEVSKGAFVIRYSLISKNSRIHSKFPLESLPIFQPLRWN